ncbi:MAG: hypothetical protein ABIJ97_05890 [Bacteroidota bacterium]
MKTQIFIFIIFFFLLFSLSCKKSKEKKVVGAWELIIFAPGVTDKTIWTFYDSDLLMILHTDSSGIQVSSDTANYEVKERFFKYYVDITNLSDDENGSYHIDKLNNSVLILQLQKPNYIRNEFVKK